MAPRSPTLAWHWLGIGLVLAAPWLRPGDALAVPWYRPGLVVPLLGRGKAGAGHGAVGRKAKGVGGLSGIDFGGRGGRDPPSTP